MIDTSTAPKASIESEEALLGAVLLWEGALEPVLTETRLRPGHFHRPQHRLIFKAMLALHDQDAPIDVLTVKEELKRLDAGETTPDGYGMSEGFVDGLTGLVPAVGNATKYAKRIVELHRWRQEQRAAFELLEAAKAEDREQRDKALSVLMRPDPAAIEVTSSKDALGDMMMRHFEQDQDETFKLPFKRLNELTLGGFRRGQVTYIGAWTSHGKSVFLDQLMEHFSRQARKTDGRPLENWLYINEMTRKERVCRVLSSMTGVPSGDILMNDLTETQMQSILTALGRLPFGITDCDGWSAEEIARDARSRNLDVIGVDILHNIPYEDEGDLRRAAQTFKSLAAHADAHVLVTIHLNTRRLQNQTSPAPTRGDIRGSGMIANLAQNVLFVHREQEEKSGLPLDRAWVYFTKVRTGRVGGVTADFNGDAMRFEERQDSFAAVPDAA